MDAEPIRMRVYGMFRMTRTGYLIVQGTLAAALVAAILWWVLSGMADRWRHVWVLYRLQWIFGALLIFESIETYFMLSAFHRKQRIAERSRRR